MPPVKKDNNKNKTVNDKIIKAQIAEELHRGPRKNFKRRQVVVKGIFETLQVN